VPFPGKKKYFDVQNEGKQTMQLKTVKYDVINHVATITLCRPQRMNAWTGRMHTEYRHVLEQAEYDSQVGVIILTGEGRAFCAGADTKALEGHVEKGGYDPGTPDPLAKPGYGVRPEFDATFAYHFGLSKPILAAINGPAAGIGLVLACYADLRFAAQGVKFTAAHGRFNFPAEFGLSWVLPRIVGLTHANDILLSSRIFVAEEALEMGLLNKVLPSEDLMAHVQDYAENLVSTVAPGSLAATKRQIYSDLHQDAASAVVDSEQRLETMSRQPDYTEGVKAFMEKRKPNWQRT
jgi:enoyl-CoA hydratase/carnithine racemase